MLLLASLILHPSFLHLRSLSMYGTVQIKEIYLLNSSLTRKLRWPSADILGGHPPRAETDTPVNPVLGNAHTNSGFSMPFCFQVRSRYGWLNTEQRETNANMGKACNAACTGAIRRSIKLTNFCGRDLVSKENQLMKSLNHDTRHLSRHDSDDREWQTMRTPTLLCCFIFRL